MPRQREAINMAEELRRPIYIDPKKKQKFANLFKDYPGPEVFQRPSFAQRLYQYVFQRLSWTIKTIQPYVNFQNLLMLLGVIAIAHFVIQSLIQTMFYVNILFIAHRVLHPEQTSGITPPGSAFLRKCAMLTALAGVVMQFAIPFGSVLMLALYAPLTLFIVTDQIHKMRFSPVDSTSQKGWLMSKLASITARAYDDWDFLLVALPYLHRTALSSMNLMLHLSVFSMNPTFQAIYTIASNQYLPSLLTALSSIGGLSLLQSSKDVLLNILKGRSQTAYQYVVGSAQTNPELASQMLKWVMSFVSTVDSGQNQNNPQYVPSR